ncbi:MAG: hypothetical protein ABL949_05395 [Fimbriimonadaceae bacterium]
MLVPALVLSLLTQSPDRLYVSVGTGTPSEVSRTIVENVSNPSSNTLVRKDVNDKLTVFYDPNDESLVSFRKSAQFFEECSMSLQKNIISSIDLSKGSQEQMAAILSNFGDVDFTAPTYVNLIPSVSLDFGQLGGEIQIRPESDPPDLIPARIISSRPSVRAITRSSGPQLLGSS